MSHLSSRNRGLRRRQHRRCSILEVRVWGHSEPSDHKPEPDLPRCNVHLNVSCTTGVGLEVARMWGKQALDTKDSDWMLLKLLLQLASTPWTRGHSCPSQCRHGLGPPCKHPTPEHQCSSLFIPTSPGKQVPAWLWITEVESGSVAETPAVWNPALSLAFKSGIGIYCLGVLYSGF